MVFDKPKRPDRTSASQQPNAATQRSQGSNQRKNSNQDYQKSGGDRGGNHQNQSNDNQDNEPSPWLGHPLDPAPNPISAASFVEYLRWMRSLPNPYKDGTKLQIMQLAVERGNYQKRLEQLTNRTKLIAGKENCFQVKCPWRIRVGGHRGPESILLPAFDSLGIPFIPSSTLRGIARSQAFRELTVAKHSQQSIEKEIASLFGSIEEGEERMGKVIFLDAYPLPQPTSVKGGLEMDIANNIWQWNEDNGLDYSPNPNFFFSLKEPIFLIGIRPGKECLKGEFERVKQCLISGLQAGVGSQVNTGYGELLVQGKEHQTNPFLKVEFDLEGQLIHGQRRFDQWSFKERQGWQARTTPVAEVRSVAFKSMLRYWFRVFSLGVLPPKDVKDLEAKLFGSIQPQTLGWVAFHIYDGKIVKEAKSGHEGKKAPCGEQSGTLALTYSSAAPSDLFKSLSQLFKNLTWMMFHLGGIGQGARRPCYSRKTREKPPWWRGSTLIPEDTGFWELPEDIQSFQKLFLARLEDFFGALQHLVEGSIDPRSPLKLGQVSKERWVEAIDANCRILVCTGSSTFDKPYALSVLHSRELKVPDRNGLDYDGNLCGSVRGKTVKPSPVWISDLGDYQVVTVFGANENPRQRYIQMLKPGGQSCKQMWPLDA